MNFRMVRVSLLLSFVLILLMLSWELARFQAVLADGPIPKEAIRLRILANSDTVADQVVKRKVRDVVVAQMKQWAERPLTIEQARQTIRDNKGTLEQLVKQTLEGNGFAYWYKVELATVPFPTKLYGDKLYPAGNYEALRITLGRGEGANWWCVLFPPLCFVDAVHGVAVSQNRTKKQPTKVKVHSYFYDKIKQIGKKK